MYTTETLGEIAEEQRVPSDSEESEPSAAPRKSQIFDISPVQPAFTPTHRPKNSTRPDNSWLNRNTRHEPVSQVDATGVLQTTHM
eukprot:m.122916 g.122916  ORF g.122916 m.122916 type:complete len:85 (-) comp14612_c0_seq2:33-287(-)